DRLGGPSAGLVDPQLGLAVPPPSHALHQHRPRACTRDAFSSGWSDFASVPAEVPVGIAHLAGVPPGCARLRALPWPDDERGRAHRAARHRARPAPSRLTHRGSAATRPQPQTHLRFDREPAPYYATRSRRTTSVVKPACAQLAATPRPRPGPRL